MRRDQLKRVVGYIIYRSRSAYLLHRRWIRESSASAQPLPLRRHKFMPIRTASAMSLTLGLLSSGLLVQTTLAEQILLSADYR